MPLGPDRILMEGESPHQWERDAMRFIKEAIPNGDPYVAALQVDLHGPSGTLHQLDAVVLGYHALYVVEVKSHPGTLDGNYADWTFTFPDGKRSTIDNPIRETAHKAKVLASVLQRAIPDLAKCPWVEPLVLLSDPGLVVRLGENYRGGVVTRVDFARAVTFGEVPLAKERLQRRVVNRPMMRAVAEALRHVLTPSRAGLRWGDFAMMRVVEEGAGWQDWLAEHSSHREMHRRIRVYPVLPSSIGARCGLAAVYLVDHVEPEPAIRPMRGGQAAVTSPPVSNPNGCTRVGECIAVTDRERTKYAEAFGTRAQSPGVDGIQAPQPGGASCFTGQGRSGIRGGPLGHLLRDRMDHPPSRSDPSAPRHRGPPHARARGARASRCREGWLR